MLKLIILFFFILSQNLLASSIPTNSNEFCNRLNDQTTIKNLSFDSDNFISFKNNGGLFNGGVCWWHARFQRNIFYSTILRPDLNRPTTDEAVNIIKSIRNSNSVTIIPGFDKISDFTNIYKDQIQKELNSWQLYDGVILGGWIDGIKGDTTTDSETLRSMMNELHDYVAVKNKIAYQKLQIKGITSHAWLVTNTLVNEEGGLVIGYIDSNDPTHLNQYTYKQSDKNFNIKGYGNFVPYLEFKREEEKLQMVSKNFCNKAIAINFNESDYWDDITDFENNN